MHRQEDDCAQEQPGSQGRWRATATVVGIYVALAVVCYWRAWWSGAAHHSLLGGDQYQTTWYLAWTPFAIFHGHNPLFSSYINYPFGANVSANTGIPLLGLIATPVTLLFGATAAFNTMLTLALAASATSAYVLARRFISWRPAAFVAGLVYGFSPFEIAQGTGHLFLSFAAIPPLILLVVYDIVASKGPNRLRLGVVLGLLVAAQYFVSSEILADTAIVTAIGLVVLGAANWRNLVPHLRRIAVPMSAAAGTAGVLLAYPVWFALAGPGHITGPIQLIPQAYRGDLLGPIVPDRFQALAPTSLANVANHFSNSWVENGTYLGITLLLVLAVGVVVLRRLAVVRMLAVMGAASFVLSLGASLAVKDPPDATPSGIPLPERLLAKSTLLANIIPARFSMFSALFAGVLLGVVLDRLHRHLASGAVKEGNGASRRPSRRRTALVVPGLVAVFALVPLIPAVPYSDVGPVGAPASFTSATLRYIPAGSAVVIYPYAGNVSTDPIIWQASTNLRFKMPGGGGVMVDSGSSHRIAFSSALGYDRITLVGTVLSELAAGHPPAVTGALRSAIANELSAWHIAGFIAVPGDSAYPSMSTSYLETLLGTPRSDAAGTLVWTRPVRDIVTAARAASGSRSP